jgi:outer membrane protein assembly factor BamD (BamD/ComL family)
VIARDTKAFENAKDSLTIKAFNNALYRYPVSKYRDSVLYYFDSISFAEALTNPQKLARFLRVFPQSAYYADALLAYEDAVFQQTKESNSLESWNAFIQKFPLSNKRREAINYRDNLLIKLFSEMQELNEMNRAIYEYPSLLDNYNALVSRDSIAFIQVDYEYDVQSYNDFIYTYINSPYRSTAEKVRDKLAFEIAASEKSVEPLLRFIEDYPMAAQIDSAKTLVNHLRRNEPIH